jgi:hypothetical protein
MPCLITAAGNFLLSRRTFEEWLFSALVLALTGAMFFAIAGTARVMYLHNFLVERQWILTVLTGTAATSVTALLAIASEHTLPDPTRALLFTFLWPAATASCNWIALRPMRS